MTSLDNHMTVARAKKGRRPRQKGGDTLVSTEKAKRSAVFPSRKQIAPILVTSGARCERVIAPATNGGERSRGHVDFQKVSIKRITRCLSRHGAMAEFHAALGHRLHETPTPHLIRDVPRHAAPDQLCLKSTSPVGRITRDLFRHSTLRKTDRVCAP